MTNKNKLDKDKNKQDDILSVKKCLTQVDLVDFYITKNIVKIASNEFEFLKSHIFLTGITNKNNKNGLIILLEANKYDIVKKLIENNPSILAYKNVYENNLIKTLLAYDYFYDLINDYILNYDRNFMIKILTKTNSQEVNFVDNLVSLINLNSTNITKSNSDLDTYENVLLKKTILMGKNIHLMDCEKQTLIITKLSKVIMDENFLLRIFKYFSMDNFDAYPDKNLLNCIDYLIINGHYECLHYMLDKINHIEFINIDDNFLFKFVQDEGINLELRTNVILKILYKSNIAKFKNNKNQNIFYFLLNQYNIEPNILTNFSDTINLYEQDIYGISLYDILKKKFKKINNIEKQFKNAKKNFDNFEKINKKMRINKKLIKSDIGIFMSNMTHNMLYTLVILKHSHKFMQIPYHIMTLEQKKNQLELMEMSNNEKSIIGYIRLFFNNYCTWMPHLILWKNKCNYWIDPNLIDSIRTLILKKVKFVYVKLSVYLSGKSDTRHSNVIIIDNVSKIVERFEPYGEMIFTNSTDINLMIKSQIASKLGYEFIFVQPYPGFQSRSDEFAKYNKSYGDPMGFCLAWSFMYIYVKMELFRLGSNINPIDFINWYVINKFSKDFNIDKDENKTNKYILFIRYFAMYLDTEKNKLIKSYGLEPGLSYQTDFEEKYHAKLVENINADLKRMEI